MTPQRILFFELAQWPLQMQGLHLYSNESIYIKGLLISSCYQIEHPHFASIATVYNQLKFMEKLSLCHL
jgi:hypothetical protein